MIDINFEIFIGPWVLPNEEIPVHITWDNDFDFSHIEIIKPRDLKFIEAVNIDKYDMEDAKIKVLKRNIRKHSIMNSFPNFFGLIFSFNNPNFPDLKLFKDIEISFYKNSILLKKFNFIAKIFRPQLKNISNISPIILKDDEKDYSVKIDLECKGFGYVLTSIEAEINKVKITFDDSLFQRVYINLEKKYLSFLKKKDHDEIYNGRSKFFKEINEDSVKRFLEILKQHINIKENGKGDIIEILDKENVNILFIIDFIVEIIKELKIRHKSENLLLKNPVLEIPKENFDEFIHNIKFYINYQDLIGNNYEPIEIDLKIEDFRYEPQKARINFLITVDKIKDNTFKDIEKVERI